MTKVQSRLGEGKAQNFRFLVLRDHIMENETTEASEQQGAAQTRPAGIDLVRLVALLFRQDPSLGPPPDTPPNAKNGVDW